MNQKRGLFKSSVISLVLMMVMLFAMSITVFAVNDVSGLQQTDASDSSVKIAWNAVPGAKGYNVYYSADGVNFARKGGSTSKYPDAYEPSCIIGNLSPGCTYWVSIAAVDGKYNEGTRSVALEVVTTPSRVAYSSFVQTDAQSESVSFSWGAVSGATGYLIYTNDDVSLLANVNTNAVTLPAVAGSSNDYKIYPYRTASNGVSAMASYTTVLGIKAAPGKVQDVADGSVGNLVWNTGSNNNCTVSWNRNANDQYWADGYKVEIYSLAGKKIKTYNTDKYTTYKKFNLKSVKNKGFKVRVRAYITLGANQCYGKWSGKKTIIPQAGVSMSARSRSTTAKCTWKKVANVTKYYVYTASADSVSALSKKNFKKVATLKKSATSYTYKKMKKGKYNGIYIIPVVKVGKKTYKAEPTWYSYIYVYK